MIILLDNSLPKTLCIIISLFEIKVIRNRAKYMNFIIIDSQRVKTQIGQVIGYGHKRVSGINRDIVFDNQSLTHIQF